MSFQKGETIGPYEIDGPIGSGGMATVYKAHHSRLDRYVAIKVMHKAFLQDANFLARFSREARIVARLEHPNIVPIYDYDEYQGEPYLVMKIIEGPTLKQKMLKQGVTLQETILIMRDIASALDYAHAHDVLHRDMKPSNVLIDRQGKPYITDFGLARLTQLGESTISQDMMLGTPYYISPEQAQGEKDLDHRTDIYSLAIILYEMITGRVPFMADTPYAIVHGHIYSVPDAPSVHKAGLPPAVDQVLLRGLAKARKDRYDSASVMIADLEAALAEAGTELPPMQVQRTPTPAGLPPVPDMATPPISQSINNRPKNPASEAKEPPYAGEEMPRKRRVELEGSLDMGRIDFQDLGKRIGSRVQGIASMIEERIDSELKTRNPTLDPEEQIRRRVRKRLKARSELAQHLAVYVAVNAMLIMIWVVSGADFPWPLFPLGFWGIGVGAQFFEYYNEYGRGAQKQEEYIQREIDRELQRNQFKQKNKSKRDEEDAASLSQLLERDRTAYRNNLNDGYEVERGGVRLNEDGEFTDSFIEDIERGDRRR